MRCPPRLLKVVGRWDRLSPWRGALGAAGDGKCSSMLTWLRKKKLKNDAGEASG